MHDSLKEFFFNFFRILQGFSSNLHMKIFQKTEEKDVTYFPKLHFSVDFRARYVYVVLWENFTQRQSNISLEKSREMESVSKEDLHHQQG